MGGIAWSGVDVHNGPTSFIAVERTALPGGFFMSAIWILDELTANPESLAALPR
jgi:hypothetical protein